MKIWLKIALNAVRLPKFEPVNGISWSPRKIIKIYGNVPDWRDFCVCADSCLVFNTGPYIVLSENSILITANMQSETGFPSSDQLKSYVASKSRMKLATRAVLSVDGVLLVLSLTVEALQGKTCQNSQPSGVAGHFGPKF